MRNLVVLSLAVVLVAGLTGCGGPTPDGVMQEQITIINEMAEVIEKGGDKAKLDEVKKKAEANKKKMEELKLSQEEEKKLREKHKPEFDKATMRLIGAMINNAGKLGDFKMPDFSGTGGK